MHHNNFLHTCFKMYTKQLKIHEIRHWIDWRRTAQYSYFSFYADLFLNNIVKCIFNKDSLCYTLRGFYDDSFEFFYFSSLIQMLSTNYMGEGDLWLERFVEFVESPFDCVWVLGKRPAKCDLLEQEEAILRTFWGIWTTMEALRNFLETFWNKSWLIASWRGRESENETLNVKKN